ncbi:unnamed protein product [Lymnaea stagnalis]|uniref:Calcineurin-like phosphoesterase domain-containing protein n=1 Tax=Lymnaea stagnalis TaxID=6523 RepID=A0AAV2HJL0_LYMST
MEEKSPHLTFGIIADVQYADCENGTDFSKTRKRFYRNSLNLLKGATDYWISLEDPISMVLQLGDLIDRNSCFGGKESSTEALNVVLQPLNSLTVPICHVLGNHDLYCFTHSFYQNSSLHSSRSLIPHRAETFSDNMYYTFLPHPKLRIVAIDTYELGLLGYEDDLENEHFQTAQSLIKQHNPNDDITLLEGFNKRWASYNGGASQKQLLWLSNVLENAQNNEENVIIISHVPLLCDDGICLAWNYEEIIDIIKQYKCVIGVFAGHDHAGWAHFDKSGIQHITFQGVIETPPGEHAHAVARLWNHTLSITGVGRVPSFNISLHFPIYE